MFQKNAMLHVGLKIHSRTRKHPKLALDHSSHARKRKKLPSAWLDRDVVVHLSWCHCHRLELLAFCASLVVMTNPKQNLCQSFQITQKPSHGTYNESNFKTASAVSQVNKTHDLSPTLSSSLVIFGQHKALLFVDPLTLSHTTIKICVAPGSTCG